MKLRQSSQSELSTISPYGDTVRQLLETSLRNKNSLVPMIEGQIKQVRTRLDEARRTIESFSKTLADTSADPTRNLAEVCKVLLEEREKAKALAGTLEVEIRQLETKKWFVADKFEKSTLPQFLERTVKQFDKLSEAEKKKIIQTIIPRIVVDPEKPNQIELLVNPDPKNPLLPSRLTEEQKVRFSKDWLGN